MNNFQWRFIDCNNNLFSNKKILFTPIQSPEITGSYLTTADSYQFTTSNYGEITTSIVSNYYKIEIASPVPATNFYISASEASSTIYSGSIIGGTLQYIFFDLINLVKNPLQVKKVTLTPISTYPNTFDNQIVISAGTSSLTNNSGYAEFQSVVPGTYQVDVYGKVDTSFYISVPHWVSVDETWSPKWNAKDILVTKPPKSTPIKLNCTDQNFVLTVNSSDARYVRVGGSGSVSTASYSEYAKTSGTSVSASHADWADVATYALTANSSIYSALATQATLADTASSVPAFLATSATKFNVVGKTDGNGTLLQSGVQVDNTNNIYGTASWALNAINGGTSITTGSKYPITSSWANSASFANRLVNYGSSVGFDAINGNVTAYASKSIDFQSDGGVSILTFGGVGIMGQGDVQVWSQQANTTVGLIAGGSNLTSGNNTLNIASLGHNSSLNIITNEADSPINIQAGNPYQTGVVNISGSEVNIINANITGGLEGTASWATYATQVVAKTPPTAALMSILSQATGEDTVQISSVQVNNQNVYGTASWATNTINANSSSYLSASTATVGTLTVTGQLNATQISGSQIYVTSSHIVISDNILELNAQSPHLRYAGISMYDSGSDNVSNFLWDGEGNYFFLSSSDAGYSRKVITGPNGEGDLTPNRIVAANDGVGLRDSIISEAGDIITIDGNLSVTDITASGTITGTVTNALTASNLQTVHINSSGLETSVLIGASAGGNAINSTNAVQIGYIAGYNAITSSDAVIIGKEAGLNATDAADAVLLGHAAGANATNANESVKIGYIAGYNSTISWQSVQVGTEAGYNSTTASNAVQIGNNAGRNSTNASEAIQIGDGVGYNSTTASYAIEIGAGAGGNTIDATNAIIIGVNSQGSASSVVIGYQATASAANQMVLGGTNITSTVIRGNVIVPNGITASLQGTASWAISASWAPTSAASNMATSASWASSSLTASYISQSITFPTAKNGYYLVFDNNTIATSSFISQSTTTIVALAPITGTISNATTASYAIQTLASTYTLDPSGFPNRTDSTLSSSDGNRTVYIYPSTVNGFEIFSKGVPYKFTTTQSMVLPTTSGSVWYVYFDKTTHLLNTSSVEWNFGTGDVPMAVAYWDGVRFTVSDERHGMGMDADTHRYLHETMGPRYSNGLTGTFSTNGTFNITAGDWFDDDLQNGPLTTLSQSRIAYITGGVMVNLPLTTSFRNGQFVYNSNVAGGGALTAFTGNNQYGAYFVYAVNGISSHYVTVFGQRVDTSLANAQANNVPENLTFLNFPYKEAKLLYRYITNGSTTITNTTDYRSAQYGGSTFVPTSHGSLSGLTADDHPQYLLLAGRGGQTVTDQLTVTGITSSLYGTASNSVSSSYASAADSYVGTSMTIAGGLPTIVTVQTNRDSTFGNILKFAESRGTAGSPTPSNIDDRVGAISYQGYDGTAYRELALISGYADDSNFVTSHSPGRLVFFTTPSGSITPVERMRIDNTGSVIISKNITAQSFTGSLQGTASWANALPNPVLRSDTFTYNFPGAVSIQMTSNILTMSFASATGSNDGFLLQQDWTKFNSKQNALGTGSTYPFTASWANNVISASYAPGNPSISASYAVTASYALNGGSGGSVGELSVSNILSTQVFN